MAPFLTRQVKYEGWPISPYGFYSQHVPMSGSRARPKNIIFGRQVRRAGLSRISRGGGGDWKRRKAFRLSPITYVLQTDFASFMDG